ncbi:hypothetical protein CBR_g51410, partial [Chara braunii]
WRLPVAKASSSPTPKIIPCRFIRQIHDDVHKKSSSTNRFWNGGPRSSSTLVNVNGQPKVCAVEKPSSASARESERHSSLHSCLDACRTGSHENGSDAGEAEELPWVLQRGRRGLLVAGAISLATSFVLGQDLPASAEENLSVSTSSSPSETLKSTAERKPRRDPFDFLEPSFRPPPDALRVTGSTPGNCADTVHSCRTRQRRSEEEDPCESTTTGDFLKKKQSVHVAAAAQDRDGVNKSIHSIDQYESALKFAEMSISIGRFGYLEKAAIAGITETYKARIRQLRQRLLSTSCKAAPAAGDGVNDAEEDESCGMATAGMDDMMEVGSSGFPAQHTPGITQIEDGAVRPSWKPRLQRRTRQQTSGGKKLPPGSNHSCNSPPFSDPDSPDILTAECADERRQTMQQLAQMCLREPQMRLTDIGGMADVKDALVEGFLIPLSYPDLFHGLRSPLTNILLFGKPGTGKTRMAEALAAEARCKFLVVTPSTVLSKWTGESERTLRGVFDLARELRPAMVFIDEIDALGASRGCNDDTSSRRLVTELLVQMNQIALGDQIYIIAATNRVQDLDEALLRRFEMRVKVPLPDPLSRQKIIELYLKDVESCLSNGDLELLASETEGYSGSDLKTLCREVAMRPAREAVRALTRLSQAGGVVPSSPFTAANGHRQALTIRPMTMEDFHEALKTFKPAARKNSFYADAEE